MSTSSRSSTSRTESLGRTLDVLVNHRHIGTLRESNDLWSFEYTAIWSADRSAFNLSPWLRRETRLHTDGATARPVQWYFDNLLPEEALRIALAREAHVDAEDSFGLLAHYGEESAGSLELRTPGNQRTVRSGERRLSFDALSRRIRNLSHTTLARGSAKRMSLAGAQHKLVVLWRNGELFEPRSGTASTHILKPEHPSGDYPASVINEYFSMRLADALGLSVPRIERIRVPESVYLVERFDRGMASATGEVVRRHAIDTCQLLNKARAFKYTGATLDSLYAAVNLCRARIATRIALYRWIVFNVLIGNADNHLKNLSFLVTSNGIALAPFYDLLSTAVYTTKALADRRATWPNTELALPLGAAGRFSALRRAHLIDAGRVLGLGAPSALRELDRMCIRLPIAANSVLADIDAELALEASNQHIRVSSKHGIAAEQRVLRSIISIVIRDMIAMLGS